MSKQYNVAILGATGAVGTRMIEQLAQSTIPVKHVKLLASKKSAGKTLQFKGQPVTVEYCRLLADRFPRSFCQKPLSAGQSVLTIPAPFGWSRMCRWSYQKSTKPL